MPLPDSIPLLGANQTMSNSNGFKKGGEDLDPFLVFAKVGQQLRVWFHVKP
jgi:hypothetical protein